MRKMMLRLCAALVLCLAVLAAVPQHTSAAYIEKTSSEISRSMDPAAYIRSWVIGKGTYCADDRHSPVTDAAVAPTCTAAGLTEGSHCQTCGLVLVAQKTVPALGHDEVIDKGYAAKCKKDGLTDGAHCGRCGVVLVEQKVIIALKHATETDLGVGPTCTRPGLSDGAYCTICGEELREKQEIPATGHTGETKPAEEPTCTDHGLTAGSSCIICGEVLSGREEIPALGHDTVADPGYAATCTEPGLTDGEHCRRCRLVMIAQAEIPALGHSFAEEWTRNETEHWHECRCGLKKDAAPHTDGDGDLQCDVCRGVLGRATFEPDLILPEALVCIEDEAFRGVPAAMVFLPEGVVSIGSKAFAECAALEQIYIPASVTDINADAFDGCKAGLIIYGAEGSEAQRFAGEKGFYFVAE